MMNSRAAIIRASVLVVLILWCGGCSVRRNTMFSRTYHSLTTRYNVLYNGQERFRKAVRSLEEAGGDDFARLLPVFPDDVTGAYAQDMDYVLAKADKAIALHSIKAKPPMDRMRLSPEQLRFYNKKEFNVFLSECYLLKGKAYFMKQQYLPALETFNQMIEFFPAERILFHAELWRIRTLVRADRMQEANEAAEALLDNEQLPPGRRYTAALYATLAEKALAQEDLAGAAGYLEEALKHTGPARSERSRGYFLLGQLYQQEEKDAQALQAYELAARKGTPELTLHARLRAILLAAGGASPEGSPAQAQDAARLQLRRLLREDRYRAFHAAVYYVWGELEEQAGTPEQALDYYLKSLSLSGADSSRKGAAALKAARLLDTRKDYLRASAYYDSAFFYLGSEREVADSVRVRAGYLSDLVVSLKTIALQDSQNAWYDVGYLYAHTLSEPRRAIACFRTLLERFPQSALRHGGQYHLWFLYSRLGVQDSADWWRGRLMEEAPGSRFALMASGAGADGHSIRLGSEALYQQVFDAFERGDYARVIADVRSADSLPADDPLRAAFDYLGIVSRAALSPDRDSLPSRLAAFIGAHEGSGPAVAARQLLSVLEPDSIHLSRPAPDTLSGVFSPERNQPHAVGVWLHPSDPVPQFTFDLFRFHSEYFEQAPPAIRPQGLLQGRNMVWIEWFDSYPAALTYYRTLSARPGVLTSLTAPFDLFVISQTNQDWLLKGASLQEYLEFFREQYLSSGL